MTQKAIKAYVDNAAFNPSGSNNTTNITFNVTDAGKIIVIGADGNVIASDISESELISLLLRAGTYTAVDGIGIDIDYANKSFSRV
jgi:hypothetical protein